ncbi:hypothetical protein J6590_039339 [Homalodisca vitripennis]|nr:hypothetical protein J6590_039339 [Homalodisca vitripennis]
MDYSKITLPHEITAFVMLKRRQDGSTEMFVGGTRQPTFPHHHPSRYLHDHRPCTYRYKMKP